ncbi:phosphonate C-P lyase system protein PhnL [Bacillus horti]|uniref:Alpha-D-ribose 1-methylphosphonate 5-triphosphate synthase subunit PhnL n=1 Tax=Caldalkalibacillus horti TaxID=77523 RepID=A0ABT9W1U7_9BACI|nr:ATP-binding cassette domain-containing protein [Bacillus horti]MDQ0167044.1 alpha-D-ribose 1-methylphosphonate 5-triphosphate synthase subunit PhnL [Bacillus horti]
MKELLLVNQLEKSFTLHHAKEKIISGCKGVSFVVYPKEFVGITGKSGAGKSTILKSIYRTYVPSGGQIMYDSTQFGPIDLVQATEREILALRKQEIGYVSQFLNAMPRITALEFVVEALLEMGVAVHQAEREAKEMLQHFKLPESLWDSFPRTFSGGEKLRLNLAQAMVKKPRILLLDEPTASLDQQSKEAVKEVLIQLKHEGTSMLGIFHDLDFMTSVVDRQYQLSAGLIEMTDKLEGNQITHQVGS